MNSDHHCPKRECTIFLLKHSLNRQIKYILQLNFFYCMSLRLCVCNVHCVVMYDCLVFESFTPNTNQMDFCFLSIILNDSYKGKTSPTTTATEKKIEKYRQYMKMEIKKWAPYRCENGKKNSHENANKIERMLATWQWQKHSAYSTASFNVRLNVFIETMYLHIAKSTLHTMSYQWL